MKLIVVSGLPGTGKSTLAEALARKLEISVFAKDWLEATLLGCELIPGKPERPLGAAGYELLTTLAERQLHLGQSVILDSVATTQTIRRQWRQLVDRYHGEWQVIECICSDPDLHRKRLQRRQRGIPGWHELTWSGVESVKSSFIPWDEPRLVLDSVRSFESNLRSAVKYCHMGPDGKA